MGGGKVLADDRDQLDGGEPRSGKAEIAGATAEDITGAFGRGVHRVQGDRAHHEDRLYLVAHQTCKGETTWYSAGCSVPFGNFSSMRIEIPTTFRPSSWTRGGLAGAGPP